MWNGVADAHEAYVSRMVGRALLNDDVIVARLTELLKSLRKLPSYAQQLARQVSFLLAPLTGPCLESICWCSVVSQPSEIISHAYWVIVFSQQSCSGNGLLRWTGRGGFEDLPCDPGPVYMQLPGKLCAHQPSRSMVIRD